MRAAARRGALLLLSTLYVGVLASDQMTEALAAALQAQAQRMEEAHRKELAALTARLHEQSAPPSQQHLTVTADGGVRIASGEHVDSLQRTLEAALSKIEALEQQVAELRAGERDLPRIPPAASTAAPARRAGAVRPESALDSESDSSVEGESGGGGGGSGLSSSSINELGLSGPDSTVTWNSNTEGSVPFSCRGDADGILHCSGELRAADFALSAEAGGGSLHALQADVALLKQRLAEWEGGSPPSLSGPPPSGSAHGSASTAIAEAPG